MSTQPPTPQPVADQTEHFLNSAAAQLAHQRQLGEQTASVYKQGSRGSAVTGAVIGLVFVLIIMAIAVGAAIFVLEVGNYSVVLKVLIAAVLVVGAFLIARPDRQFRRVFVVGPESSLIAVYQRGFIEAVVQAPDQPRIRAFPWVEITRMHVARHSSRGSGYSYNQFNVWARGDESFGITYHAQPGKLAAAAQTIKDSFDQYLIGQAVEAMRRGEQFGLGPARLSQQGLFIKDAFTPWQNVKEIKQVAVHSGQIAETGYEIRTHDNSRGGTVTYTALTSPSAFVTLVTHFAQESQKR